MYETTHLTLVDASLLRHPMMIIFLHLLEGLAFVGLLVSCSALIHEFNNGQETCEIEESVLGSDQLRLT